MVKPDYQQGFQTVNCEQLEKRITDFLDAPAPDEKGVRQVVEHLRTCWKCREKYQNLLKSDIPEQVVPTPSKIRSVPASLAEETLDFLDPIEFKDKPITFTLFLDGREEPIKLVEPEFDLPIPEESRLVVNDRKVPIADVRFSFKPDRRLPYTLNFRIRRRIRHHPPKGISFGPTGKDLQETFTETIVDEGGVHAELEMTHGKARLYIRYEPR